MRKPLTKEVLKAADLAAKWVLYDYEPGDSIDLMGAVYQIADLDSQHLGLTPGELAMAAALAVAKVIASVPPDSIVNPVAPIAVPSPAQAPAANPASQQSPPPHLRNPDPDSEISLTFR